MPSPSNKTPAHTRQPARHAAAPVMASCAIAVVAVAATAQLSSAQVATLVTPPSSAPSLGYTAANYDQLSPTGQSVRSIANQFAQLYGLPLTFTRLYDTNADPALTTASPALAGSNSAQPLVDQSWSIDPRFFSAGGFDIGIYSAEQNVSIGSQSLSDPSLVSWTTLPAGTGYGANLVQVKAGRSRLLANSIASLTGAVASDDITTGGQDRFITFHVSAPFGSPLTYAVFIDNGIDRTFTSAAILFDSAVATPAGESGSPALPVPEPAGLALLSLPAAALARRRR